MRFFITAILLCLIIIGCMPNTNSEIVLLRNQVIDLTSEVETLKVQVVLLNQEIEKQSAQINTISNVAPVPNRNWVLWETKKYFGNQLHGAIPSKALDALESKTDCLATAKSYVSSQIGSDDGSLAFQQPAALGYYVVTMICLPEGTQP